MVSAYAYEGPSMFATIEDTAEVYDGNNWIDVGVIELYLDSEHASRFEKDPAKFSQELLERTGRVVNRVIVSSFTRPPQAERQSRGGWLKCTFKYVHQKGNLNKSNWEMTIE